MSFTRHKFTKFCFSKPVQKCSALLDFNDSAENVSASLHSQSKSPSKASTVYPTHPERKSWHNLKQDSTVILPFLIGNQGSHLV